MTPPTKSESFSWGNYLPQHRGLIALRYEQSKRLHACSICKSRPIAVRKTLVHQALKSLNAESLDARLLVRALALCREHAPLNDDQLADHVWPGWR